jgi:uncharacterized membrane protein (DUF2068 family)
MPRPARTRKHSQGLLRVIAVFKLAKALLLVGIGLGALKLLDPATAARVADWVSALASQIGPRATSEVNGKLAALPHSKLLLAGIVSFLYAALFAVEGIGLWMGARWAEFLTIIATSSFVPLEVYELIKQVTPPRIATLVINLAIVGYLVWKVKQPPDRS